MNDDRDIQARVLRVAESTASAHDDVVRERARDVFGSPRRNSPWLAAAVVALLALPALLIAFESPEPITVRSGGDAVPADGHGLADLSWTPVPGAGSYQVTVRNAEAAIVWRSEAISEPRMRLPGVIVDSLDKNSRYTWTVTVRGAGQPVPLGPFPLYPAP